MMTTPPKKPAYAPPKPSKEKLLADMKGVARDATHLLRANANQAGEKLVALRDQTHEKLAATRDKIAQTDLGLADTAERAKTWAQTINERIHDHPWPAIGIAAGLAFVLGLVIGHR